MVGHAPGRSDQTSSLDGLHPLPFGPPNCHARLARWTWTRRRSESEAAHLAPGDESIAILILVLHQSFRELVLPLLLEMREHLVVSQLAVCVNVEVLEQVWLRWANRNAHHLHIKVERRTSGNVAPGAAGPVAQIWWDDKRRLGALAQPDKTCEIASVLQSGSAFASLPRSSGCRPP